MMRAIITIQAYVRMRLARLRLKQRQYKHSNDMIIQELHRHPKFSRVCSLIFHEKLIFLLSFLLKPIADDEQIKERAIICIQSCIRGYLQRCYLKRINKKKSKPTFAYETAAIIIQKCYRGFFVRKAFYRYRQRLNTQILCFLQQIELISNDFFTKIVRTNYCVPFKSLDIPSINNVHQNKYAQKFSQHLFPPPPPLPLPTPFAVLSPPLPPPNAPISIKPSIITSSIALPPPPPALFLASRHSPQSRHQVVVTNRSPSPSTPSVTKFAQVRDIFARAEAAAVSNVHHYHHVPIKQPIQNLHPLSHQVSSIEQSRSPKSVTVLDAVQEYQRQHLNNHQPGYKRFGHLGGPIHYRPMNFNGNNHLRPRGIGAFISNNINNRPLLQNKQLPPPTATTTITPSFISSSPKQPLKPITRVNYFYF